MADRAQGFSKLKGKTIAAVRAGAINEVTVTCEDGSRFAICTETSGPLGLPLLTLEERPAKKVSEPLAYFGTVPKTAKKVSRDPVPKKEPEARGRKTARVPEQSPAFQQARRGGTKKAAEKPVPKKVYADTNPPAANLKGIEKALGKAQTLPEQAKDAKKAVKKRAKEPAQLEGGWPFPTGKKP
jgi:hypothetical protein